MVSEIAMAEGNRISKSLGEVIHRLGDAKESGVEKPFLLSVTTAMGVKEFGTEIGVMAFATEMRVKTFAT